MRRARPSDDLSRGYDRTSDGVMSASTSRPSRFRSVSVSLVGAVGVVATIVAAATIWLMLTDPVTVAEAIDTGEVAPLVEELASVIYDAIVGLIKYL
jgi:hypothetical protein